MSLILDDDLQTRTGSLYMIEFRTSSLHTRPAADFPGLPARREQRRGVDYGTVFKESGRGSFGTILIEIKCCVLQIPGTGEV